MNKSFKDYYKEDKDPKKSVVLTKDPIKNAAKETETTMTVLETEKVPQVVLTEESLNKVLAKQKEESTRVFESIIKTNKNIIDSVSSVIKNSNDSHEKLTSVIEQLLERVESLELKLDSVKLLEAKLDEIGKIEIPPPVANWSVPDRKVRKEVHRDANGFITHITEEFIIEDDQNPESADE